MDSSDALGVEAAKVHRDESADARGWQPGIAVETATVGGLAAQVLQEQFRAASLLVIGGRPHDGGMLNSSVGAHLAGFTHCPVLVVNQSERVADRGPAPVARVAGPAGPGPGRSRCGPDDRAARHRAGGGRRRRVAVMLTRALEFGYDEALSRCVPFVALHAGHGRPHAAVHADLAPWLRRQRDVEARFAGSDEPVLDALTGAASGALLLVVGAHRVCWSSSPGRTPARSSSCTTPRAPPSCCAS